MISAELERNRREWNEFFEALDLVAHCKTPADLALTVSQLLRENRELRAQVEYGGPRRCEYCELLEEDGACQAFTRARLGTLYCGAFVPKAVEC